MFNYTELLSLLPMSREKMLNEIGRWSVADVFFHRSSVLFHSKRVALMVDDISLLASKYLPGYDAKKAGILAHIHDDSEMLTGDHQACHKALMTPRQKRQLAKQELAAIEKLASEFPGNIDGYNYGELLLCAYHKNCVNSQVVKLCDKLDSCCEALHEVYAGNNLPLPMLWMDAVFLEHFPQKYPLVKPLFEKARHPFINFFPRVVKPFGGQCRPHTEKSIKKKTDFPFYDRWKKLILRHLGKEGMRYLAAQKEFFL